MSTFGFGVIIFLLSAALLATLISAFYKWAEGQKRQKQLAKALFDSYYEDIKAQCNILVKVFNTREGLPKILHEPVVEKTLGKDGVEYIVVKYKDEIPSQGAILAQVSLDITNVGKEILVQYGPMLGRSSQTWGINSVWRPFGFIRSDLSGVIDNIAGVTETTTI